MDTISSQHPSPPVVKSCKVCTALEKLFADDDVQIQLEKDEIYDQSCTQHDPLFCWIERNYCEYLDRLEKARNYHIVADTNYSFGTILFFRLSGGIPRLWVYSRMGIRYGTYEVLLHSKISPEKKQKNCYSSVLDPEWVDLGILMGDIYASAKLTIVALDGDSSTGIVGLRSQSSLRSLSNIFPWQDGRSVRLTYPEDAFPAVNGLLTYLESFSFEYGSLFGLPRAVFDAALMWSYDIDADGIDVHTRFGLRRREPSERRHSVLPDTHLPSWSWIGWKGDRVRMLDTEAQFQWSGWYLDSGSGQLANSMRPSVITTPITQWYNHASHDGSDKQPIPRYPTVYNESSVISYDTEVWKRERSNGRRLHTKGSWREQKRLCGWLQLPKDEDSLRFPGADCGRMPLAVRDTFKNPFPERNQLLELVANCRRKFPDSKFGEKWVHWEDFYGVLWVKWIERVAYRRACGYVQKELWEEQDLEDVDLILG
ncbi:hypothetical protein LZL87_004343 [Fusarium oxysporum]|nr:hypothetical protein LZL87_004343 [Fusarium oxysporum]